MRVGNDERGQAIPIAALFVVLMMGSGLVLMHMASGGVDRARAQTAADAVALAAVMSGEPAAQKVASLNDSKIEDLQLSGDQAWVRVRVRDTSAEAKARQ